MPAPHGKAEAEAEEAEDAETNRNYVDLFMLKHLCGRCGGTRGPRPAGGAGGDYECNVCGERSTEADCPGPRGAFKHPQHFPQ